MRAAAAAGFDARVVGVLGGPIGNVPFLGKAGGPRIWTGCIVLDQKLEAIVRFVLTQKHSGLDLGNGWEIGLGVFGIVMGLGYV